MIEKQVWKNIDWNSPRFTHKKKKFIIDSLADLISHYQTEYYRSIRTNDPKKHSHAELAKEYSFECSKAVLYLEEHWGFVSCKENLIRKGNLKYRIKKDGDEWLAP